MIQNTRTIQSRQTRPKDSFNDQHTVVQNVQKKKKKPSTPGMRDLDNVLAKTSQTSIMSSAVSSE